MLHLARKAFYPEFPLLPFLHIGTSKAAYHTAKVRKEVRTMKRWRRITAALLCFLLCQGTALAADNVSGGAWRRSEGDGSYVTIRVPVDSDLNISDPFQLAVRYADTKEPVALVSEYLDGYLFATVPAEEADRTLEVFQSGEVDWTDLAAGSAAYGASQLRHRGVIRGDEAGRLNQDAVLTRAEAFTIIVRLLGLEPDGDPGYCDVSPEDWYYDAVSAARAAGIAENGECFSPQRAVTRAEFTVMVARAMERIGWLEIPEGGDHTALNMTDSGDIPDWAVGAYLALQDSAALFVTSRPTEEILEGIPVDESLAEPDRTVTRGEMITMLYQALRRVPVYPTETAIQLGFDLEMPVIDGSTSTYPYTQGLYSALFTNYEYHVQYPDSHSKSHESYQRLINGEVDVLFAATKASQELEEQAAEQGVELEYIPIAYDAMVFFTNVENSVTGLTSAQIQDIYVRNAYDNWNQVGGPDAALLPYCRNTDSGSHALMERYFLEDGALSLHPDILRGNVSIAMSSALTDVASALSVDPPAYAIGYSVYAYYSSYEELMVDVTPNKIKLLAIDGVLPTDETITNGTYPLSDYNYLVIRADEPEGSPARRLAEFMVSDAGQQVVSSSGFLPLPD